ncbi:MAG: hypothetical protein H0X16_09995 [Chloroflexi bacterium]|nr:hypothetical protein [Chloroflexota bacterium]
MSAHSHLLAFLRRHLHEPLPYGHGLVPGAELHLKHVLGALEATHQLAKLTLLLLPLLGSRAQRLGSLTA